MRRALVALLLAVPAALRGQVPAPNVKALGRTIARYEDERVRVVLSYRWTQTHLKSKWILLDTWISAISKNPIEIDREDVALDMPDGTRLNLPSERRMTKGIPDLRRLLAEVDISRDPAAGYFPESQEVERLGFFEIPGEYIVRDRAGIAPHALVYGDLFFEAPGASFEPGIYTLVIRNKTVDVHLPLALGIEGPLKRVK